jgi:hypothetical protein
MDPMLLPRTGKVKKNNMYTNNAEDLFETGSTAQTRLQSQPTRTACSEFGICQGIEMLGGKGVCGEEREGGGGCDAKQEKTTSRTPLNPFVARVVSSEHKRVWWY